MRVHAHERRDGGSWGEGVTVEEKVGEPCPSCQLGNFPVGENRRGRRKRMTFASAD